MKKSFTLIELMIVIAIMAILASLLISNIMVGRTAGMKYETVTTVMHAIQGLTNYNTDTGKYPPNTHNIRSGGTDPEKDLSPVNCDSLIRYLNPGQARRLGYKDPGQLGVSDYWTVPEKNLQKRFGNKWVVVDVWGRPLLFANKGATCELYSVGPNGKDELGKGDDIPQAK